MAKWIKLLEDIESPNHKEWKKGEVHLVSSLVADTLVNDKKATYSKAEADEFVEAVKTIKKKTKSK